MAPSAMRRQAVDQRDEQADAPSLAPDRELAVDPAELLERRAYHREHMVAFRVRKKAAVARLKAAHAELEAQLAQRIALRRAHLASRVDAADKSAMQLLRERFLDLVDESEMHRAESQRLQDELKRFGRLKQLLHMELALLNEQVMPKVDEDDGAASRRPLELRGFFVYFESHEPPFYFEPFTLQECDEHMEHGYAQVRVLQDAFNRGDLGMREVSCMGWRVQRSLERTRLEDGSPGQLTSRVRFTKRVRCPDGDTVATLRKFASYAYDTMSSAESYRRIQRTKFISHTLQTFGDYHQVSLRNAPEPNNSTSIRYLHLLTIVNDKYTNDAGRECVRATMLMLAMDTPRHKLIREMMHRDDIVWMTGGVAFTSFVQVDDLHFDIDYGNVTTCVSDEQAQYFMLELGAQLLRWEALVMPPRLLPVNE